MFAKPGRPSPRRWPPDTPSEKRGAGLAFSARPRPSLAPSQHAGAWAPRAVPAIRRGHSSPSTVAVCGPRCAPMARRRPFSHPSSDVQVPYEAPARSTLIVRVESQEPSGSVAGATVRVSIHFEFDNSKARLAGAVNSGGGKYPLRASPRCGGTDRFGARAAAPHASTRNRNLTAGRLKRRQAVRRRFDRTQRTNRWSKYL